MQHVPYTQIEGDTKSLDVTYRVGVGILQRVVCDVKDLHFMTSDDGQSHLGLRIDRARRVLNLQKINEFYVSEDVIPTIIIFERLKTDLSIIELKWPMDDLMKLEGLQAKYKAEAKKAKAEKRAATVERRRTKLFWRCWWSVFGGPEIDGCRKSQEVVDDNGGTRPENSDA